MRDLKIFLGDCVEQMKNIESGSIHLCITSPPYNCGKDYEGVSDNLSWESYWEFTKNYLDQVFRVLDVGCRLAVNLPWWMMKKPRRDVVFEYKKTALDSGFIFTDKILWVKGNEKNTHTSGGFGGGGSGWGTYMSPSGPSVRCCSEPILIFSKIKRGRGLVSGEGNGKCIKGDMSKDQWMEWTKDVWFFKGVSSKNHPAIFPEELPYRLIKLYTLPGETVLDPFMGTGTTGVVCSKENRSFLGIEASKKYYELSKKNLCIQSEEGEKE